MLTQSLPAWLFTAFLIFAPSAFADPGKNRTTPAPVALPFQAGEKLTYDISWSNIIHAGTAVMEVREEQGSDGRMVFHLISRATSTGVLDRFYKVSDTIESYIDGEHLYSLSYHLDQTHGKRHKTRDMRFDHGKGTVVVLSDGISQTYPVPENVQDALSSLYFVRTRRDFIVGKPITVNVHEDDKTWGVEVQTLGRERITTPAGAFDTIKIKTYPRYDGVFQNRGEIYIWFTDDARKIPVLMKSTITIGTIVSTLVELKSGESKNDPAIRSKTPQRNH